MQIFYICRHLRKLFPFWISIYAFVSVDIYDCVLKWGVPFVVVTHWQFLFGCVCFFVYAMSNFVKCILKFYFYIYNACFWPLHGVVQIWAIDTIYPSFKNAKIEGLDLPRLKEVCFINSFFLCINVVCKQHSLRLQIL